MNAPVKFVEQVKRESSKFVKTLGTKYRQFYWQRGYGMFSVGPKDCDEAEAYVWNQQEHHRTRTFQEEYRALLKQYGTPESASDKMIDAESAICELPSNSSSDALLFDFFRLQGPGEKAQVGDTANRSPATTCRSRARPNRPAARQQASGRRAAGSRTRRRLGAAHRDRS